MHKKTISYCVKRADGEVVAAGEVAARRPCLETWLAALPRPWSGALEATLFSGWIYDFLSPHAARLEMAHPHMLRSIVAAKHKSDRLRRVLRYRNLLVREAVRFKNKAACLLMEVGAEYNKGRLHGRRYFAQLLGGLHDVPEEVLYLLRMTHGNVGMFLRMQRLLLDGLKIHPLLRERVELLMSIPGHGADVGAGGRRSPALPQCFSCAQLLRPVQRPALVGGQGASRPAEQAAQPRAPARARGGGEDRAALQRAAAGGL